MRIAHHKSPFQGRIRDLDGNANWMNDLACLQRLTVHALPPAHYHPSVTVSSNEAQQVRIQKSLSQRVLIAISPAG